jgi:hypothetical protein
MQGVYFEVTRMYTLRREVTPQTRFLLEKTTATQSRNPRLNPHPPFTESPPLFILLRQMNPTHTIPFFKTRIIPHPNLGLPEVSSLQLFRPKLHT